MMPRIAPSILSADVLKLEKQIHEVEASGAAMLHIDVMDGQFVPNITMGPFVIEAIKRTTDLPLDVHLMIANPAKYIEDFKNAGADYLTVHQEAEVHLDRTVQMIKSLGVKPGVSLNPATPIEQIKWVLSEIDLVLIMSVNPGFGGQRFIPYTLEKIKSLHDMREAQGFSFDIQVDGGVHFKNAPDIVKAGADILVAGSAVFSSDKTIKEAVKILTSAGY